VERRTCGCDLGHLGLETHLCDTSSVRKLTIEGVTLVLPDVVHVLEVVLPQRFGGSALDYQLVEEERDGVAGLTLTVAPDIRLPADDAVTDVFFSSLQPGDAARDIRALWGQAGSMRIRRSRPIVTPRGKHPAIVFARPDDGLRATSDD
jgi:hypothetical protein